MRRVNLVLTTLSDPVQRRRAEPDWILHPRRSVWIGLASAVTGLFAVAFLGSYYGARQPSIARSPSSETVASAALAPTVRGHDRARVRAAMPKTKGKPVEDDRPPQSTNALPLREPRVNGPIVPALQQTATGEPPQAPLSSEPEVGPKEHEDAPAAGAWLERSNSLPSIGTGFSGSWFYALPAKPVANHRFYSPEYIEVKISAAGDQIHGQYRARYVVTDRAISPAVAFHFEGRGTTPISTLPWQGPGGAYGSVTLNLISESSLEVRWTATHLGDELRLISGIATLWRSSN
jgi:hypothetical protein